MQQQILVFEETLLLESFALYVPKFQLNASHEYKTRLDSARERQKAMIKSRQAATGNLNWEVNGSKAEGRKLVNDMTKLVVRSFNNECDYCVDNVKFDNIELGEKRIRKSFEACNHLGRVMTVRLSEEYLNLKLDELRLAHEYQVRKQEEKEEAKRVREELREQQKLEQEIRAAREKIAKERKHFAAALRDLNARLERVTSDEERSLLMTKISEVEAGKESLDSEEKTIDYREQNAKAGYVYWPAAGFKDTLLRWKMKPEVVHGEKKDIQPRVQARGGQAGHRAWRGCGPGSQGPGRSRERAAQVGS